MSKPVFIKPPKPVDEMTPEERKQFAAEVVARVGTAPKDGEKKPDDQ